MVQGRFGAPPAELPLIGRESRSMELSSEISPASHGVGMGSGGSEDLRPSTYVLSRSLVYAWECSSVSIPYPTPLSIIFVLKERNRDDVCTV